MTDERYERGLKVRREVLGDAYVDRALEGMDEFTRPLQEIVTQFCWGEMWTRPGLSRKSRSMLNLALLAALNREAEFKAHLRGAVNNGCSETEIQEILLHVGVYCGIPVAVEAFRNARSVLAEMKDEKSPAGTG